LHPKGIPFWRILNFDLNIMSIAIIKTGGKQYKVAVGDKLKIEKLPNQVGEKVKFDTLLASSQDGQDLLLGEPILKDKSVEGKILEQGKADKVSVIKFKNKTRYKRNYGHRQPFSLVEIIST